MANSRKTKRTKGEGKKHKNLLQSARRKTEREERRFCGPLINYLERMYPQVLYNYSQFYKYLDTRNPTRPDLRRSKEFRTWVRENNISMRVPPPNKENEEEDYKEIDKIFNELMEAHGASSLTLF